MVDHSEFPWGPQYEPGLLTPLGVLGWLLAAALLVAVLLAQSRNGGSAGKGGKARLEQIHTVILAVARHALKQDEFGILKGADLIRRALKLYLGGLLMAGGALGKRAKALDEAMGEKDDKKKAEEHKKGKAAHDAHGGGHGHDAHGAGGAHQGHSTPAGGAPGAVANTVQGHNITVNVGGDPGGAHGAHDEPGHDDEDKPKSLEEQLVAVRKAVREFEAWWSDKPARMAELSAARDDLCGPRPLDTEQFIKEITPKK